MATLWITQYPQAARPDNVPPIFNLGSTGGTVTSTGAAFTLGANTYMIGVQADAPVWLFGGSSTSATLPTSSDGNGQRIPANTVQFFSVNPYTRIAAAST